LPFPLVAPSFFHQRVYFSAEGWVLRYLLDLFSQGCSLLPLRSPLKPNSLLISSPFSRPRRVSSLLLMTPMLQTNSPLYFLSSQLSAVVPIERRFFFGCQTSTSGRQSFLSWDFSLSTLFFVVLSPMADFDRLWYAFSTFFPIEGGICLSG